MEIIRSKKEMQNKASELIRANKSIGFVPTMGFFHDGHLALMKQALEDNDIVVTSIFVNPLQFGPNEDYDRYPKDEERDIKLAEEVGADIVFIPEVQEMYPAKMHINLDIEGRANVLCGKKRPGHFAGVITVLAKLFHIVQPQRVYFGMKDGQQVAVVDALINDLNFPIDLVALPTIRENDGLARSSRNVNLTESERGTALSLYKALQHGRELVVDGENNPAIIVKEVMEIIDRETNGKIDYVELLSYPELQPVSVIDQQVILAVAVYFEKARLIDNLIFTDNGNLVNRL